MSCTRLYSNPKSLPSPVVPHQIGSGLMEGLPEHHMTYPDIQPVLLQRVQQWLEEGNYRPLLEDLFEQFY